jgi:hypothetical protein
VYENGPFGMSVWVWHSFHFENARAKYFQFLKSRSNLHNCSILLQLSEAEGKG